KAEDGIRDRNVTGVQTCALPISPLGWRTDCRVRRVGLYRITSAWYASRRMVGTDHRHPIVLGRCTLSVLTYRRAIDTLGGHCRYGWPYALAGGICDDQNRRGSTCSRKDASNRPNDAGTHYSGK